MNVEELELSGLRLITPKVFGDSRGFFVETYQKQRYADARIDADFVQDNHSRSEAGVLRGLHYQVGKVQAKLVWVVRGEIFDVAVDVRRNSPTLGRWTGTRLSEDNRRQMYVSAGFAHGFCVLSDVAEVVYKCSDYYDPASERTILWNDPDLGIEWPVQDPVLSEKDRRGVSFAEAELVG